MNRRGFLKVLGATIATPFVARFKIDPKPVRAKLAKFEIQDSAGTFRDITSSVSNCTFEPNTDLETMGINWDEMIKGMSVELDIKGPFQTTALNLENYHFFIDDGAPAEWPRVQYTFLADAIEDAEPGDYIIAVPDEHITLAQPQPIEWQSMESPFTIELDESELKKLTTAVMRDAKGKVSF